MSRPSAQVIRFLHRSLNSRTTSLHSTSSSLNTTTTTTATIRRNASSSSSSKPPPYPKGKPIPLEQPDKFRPPSHPSRLASSRRRPVPLQATYRSTPHEVVSQQTRTYPHMFPAQGTFMHWFLTARWLHFFITFGTLTVLGVSASVMHFRATSPYAHLLPAWTTLLSSPVSFARDWVETIRLHTDYKTQQAMEARVEMLKDTQKRRLYRRAHGMEDLDAEEGQGVDVRGLVDWDDGLTRGEREALRMRKEAEVEVQKQATQQIIIAESEAAEGGASGAQENRKIKKWFGIWS